MTDKKSFKTKFRQAKANNSSNFINAQLFTAACGCPVMMVGLILLPIDGGVTAVTGAGMMMSRVTILKSYDFPHIDTDSQDYKEMSFTLQNTKYHVNTNQWMSLTSINNQIQNLEKSMKVSDTERKRLKSKRKINKLIEIQKDILTSDNVSTIDPKEKKKTLPKLSIDRKIGRGN